MISVYLVRGLVGAAATALLAGCASNGGVQGQLRGVLAEPDAPTSFGRVRTAAEIRAYPYAQLGITLDGNVPGVAVLTGIDDEADDWVAGQDVALRITRNGRVRALRVGGLVVERSVPESDPLSLSYPASKTALPSYAVVTSVADSSGSSPRTTQLACTLKSRGWSDVLVRGQERPLLGFVERCADDAGATFELRYWLDADGVLAKLTGVLAPKAPGLELLMLKRPVG